MAEPGGSDGPIGPYPRPGVETDEQRDEYDRLRRRVLWKMPSGLYVRRAAPTAVSAATAMTINWVTQLSFDPKWIGVSVEQTAFTHELIEAGGCFAVSLVDREDRAIVRKFTKPVEVDLGRGRSTGSRSSSRSPARRSSPRRSRTSTARSGSG